ncbi:MAG: lipocalin-like domain-containing protein [Clostridia bacterium]
MLKKYLGDMRLLSTPEDYKKLGLKKGTPEIWEDGLRTDGGPGSYEWWYVDSEFDNGMVIVLTFYTKNHFDAKGPAHPTANLTITYPDGHRVSRDVRGEKGKTITASKERCDVTICDTSIKYVDGDYQVHFNEDSLNLELTMKSILPMYRPETGHCAFGDDTPEFMGWFVAQPTCQITGTLALDGKIEKLVGNGYHDHNWGIGSMFKQFNHWYWGRATVGEYTFITATIVSNATYGNSTVNLFMLGENGEILNNDLSKVAVARADTYQHEITKKFMDNHLTFTQPTQDDKTYTIEYFREKDIVAARMLNGLFLPKFIKKLIMLTVANPTYVRSLGKVRLTIDDHGEKTVIENDGLWEQMFLGKNKKAIFGR